MTVGSKIFVDSNIWIYALVLRPEEHAKHARAISLIENERRHTISNQVVAEISVNLLRKAKMDEGTVLAVVESLYNRCDVIDLNLQCHRTASSLRSRYKFSFWDSLIVAAALESDCQVLYSEDMQHNQIVDKKLNIINPFFDV